MLNRRMLVVAALLGFVGAMPVDAADWGTLKGRFVVEGKAPEAAALNTDKDQAVCAKHKLLSEKVVVDKDGDLANVVVYLRDKNPAVAPSYEASAKDTVVLDNKECHFVPHIVLLRTTQTLDVKNSDPVGHNTKADFINNASFNNLIPADSDMKVAGISKDEGLPMPFACSIHPWMSGYILIRSNPYMAASAPDGTFEIKDLPAGKELDFQFWQEAAGNLKEVAGKGFKTDSKGRAKIMIKAGDNDLGVIKVPAKLFK